ncbi:MAG TPA: hypothetical protein ENJ18_11285 [Nannocystis exedens]|nr:hypothetical protein [Nannocystis exedens]
MEEEPELELRPPVEVSVVVVVVVVVVSPPVLVVCESPDDEEEDDVLPLLEPPKVEVGVAVVKPELWLFEPSLSELLGLQAMRLADAKKSVRGE